MLKSKKLLKTIADYSVDIYTHESNDKKVPLKSILPTSFKTIEKELRVFEIIDKYPDELGFVLDSNTYEDYVKTYITLDEKLEQIKPVLSEKQFNILKEHFRGRK